MSAVTVVAKGAEGGFSVSQRKQSNNSADGNLGLGERAFSAAGAAFLSAIIVNPLDVAKTRLQAQAAGVAYSHPLRNIRSRMAYFGPNMSWGRCLLTLGARRPARVAEFMEQYRFVLQIVFSIKELWMSFAKSCHRKELQSYGEAQMLVLLWQCQPWESICHAVIYSATGWTISPHKIFLVQHCIQDCPSWCKASRSLENST